MCRFGTELEWTDNFALAHWERNEEETRPITFDLSSKFKFETESSVRKCFCSARGTFHQSELGQKRQTIQWLQLQ